jgi:hypothetical protein
VAEISVYTVEVTASQSTTTTGYLDSAASVPSTFFTSGNSYWIETRATCHSTSGGLSVGVRCAYDDGSITSFPDSERECEGYGSIKQPYEDFLIWKAVSNATFRVQFRSSSDAATALIDHIQVTAFDITDDFTPGTDYHYDLNTSNVSLQNGAWSDTNNATITFTPASANSQWLVRGASVFTGSNPNRQMMSRVNYNAGTDVVLTQSQEGEDVADIIHHTHGRVFDSLAASEHSFTMQAQLDGSVAGGETRTYSKILAINLDNFVDAENAWTSAQTTIIQGTAYETTAQTLEFTPSQAGNICVMTGFVYQPGGATDDWYHRGQIEEADVITGVTTDNYQFRGWDATDAFGCGWCTVENVAQAAQTSQ